MKAIALLYDAPDEHIRRHLAGLAFETGSRPARVWDVLAGAATGTPILLTFDDHGRRAGGRIAELLEAFSWRGHCFVTPAFIGAPGFLTAEQIRCLARRGHMIGIHGARAEEPEEWRHGTRVLGDVLGHPVCLGCVSGGYDARPAAAAAASAGLHVLFTSNPTDTPALIDGCLVLGRHTISRTTTPRAAAAWVRGSILPRLRITLAKALGVAV